MRFVSLFLLALVPEIHSPHSCCHYGEEKVKAPQDTDASPGEEIGRSGLRVSLAG